MQSFSPAQRIITGILLIGPALAFVTLRFVPSWDPAWDNHVFHFYIVSFTSLVAIVVAIFVLAGIGSGGIQGSFVAMAFVAMAGFFFLHGVATPGMLLTDNSSHGVGLSARLSLTAGAILLLLGVYPLSEKIQASLTRQRGALWAILGLAYIAYISIIFYSPDIVTMLEGMQVVSVLLALLTIALLLWALWLSWQQYQKEHRRLHAALIVALPWLAVAQVSQYVAPTWYLSWWIYHILMLAAFIVTIGALILDYEGVLHFSITRYFTALAVILGVPLVALLSEATVRLSGSEAARWPMFGFSFLALLLLFLVSLLVVSRAEAILDERAAALEEEKQWRTDFTNLIVHDLKSPLSVTSVSLSLVLGGRLDAVPDKQRVPLERAQRGTRETLELIDNLLDIEKLEAGALRLTPVSSDLTELLRTTTEALKPLADNFGLTLEAIIADTLPTLQLDEALLKRVLQNLLTNAVKFSPQGGWIKVEASKTPQHVVVTVTDNGPGVPPEQREHIFEKFVQVQGIERRGVGLGLTFCKLAVEAHGGRIWVEDAPLSGSRFVFTLPTTQESPVQA